MRDVIYSDDTPVVLFTGGNYPGDGPVNPAGKEIPTVDGKYVDTKDFKLVGGISTGLSGAGTSNQNTAAVCPSKTNVFSTVAANAGCKLGVSTIGDLTTNLAIGDEIHVVNHGANALLVYPPTGGKINNGTANAAHSLEANASVIFKAISTVDLVTI